MFRGYTGCAVLRPHSSKGVWNIQARVTVPGTEAANSPQFWGIGEWGCAHSPCHPPSPPPRFRRDGSPVPKGVVEHPLCQHGAWAGVCFGAPLAHCPSFSPYLLRVVVIFLPHLLLLLLLHLALPPAHPAGPGALPITVAPRRLGHARLGQAALGGEQKTTAGGSWHVPSAPSCSSCMFHRGPGVPREQRVLLLCMWEEILRVAGSSGILAQVRDGVPTTVLGGRGEVAPSPRSLWAPGGAFCFREDVMVRL